MVSLAMSLMLLRSFLQLERFRSLDDEDFFFSGDGGGARVTKTIFCSTKKRNRKTS